MARRSVRAMMAVPLVLAGYLSVVAFVGRGERRALVPILIVVAVVKLVAAHVLANHGEAILGAFRDSAAYHAHAVEMASGGRPEIGGSAATQRTGALLGQLYLLTGTNSWQLSFYLSGLVGFLGQVVLLPRKVVLACDLRLIVAYLLFPSGLVWMSLYGKDSFALLGLALVVRSWTSSRLASPLLLAAGLAMVWAVRPELLLVVALAAVAWWGLRARSPARLWSALAFGVVIVLAGNLAPALAELNRAAELTERGGSAIPLLSGGGTIRLLARGVLLPVRPLPVAGLASLLGFLEAVGLTAWLYRRRHLVDLKALERGQSGTLAVAIALVPALAALSNEGLLARQRLPFSLLLFAVGLAAEASAATRRVGGLPAGRLLSDEELLIDAL